MSVERERERRILSLFWRRNRYGIAAIGISSQFS